MTTVRSGSRSTVTQDSFWTLKKTCQKTNSYDNGKVVTYRFSELQDYADYKILQSLQMIARDFTGIIQKIVEITQGLQTNEYRREFC